MDCLVCPHSSTLGHHVYILGNALVPVLQPLLDFQVHSVITIHQAEYIENDLINMSYIITLFSLLTMISHSFH